MLDTVILFCEQGKMNSNVKDVRSEINSDGELISKRGVFKNLNLLENSNGLLINGSLSRFYFNNNLYTLQRKDIERAIELLSMELGIDIRESKVYRIDIATNILCSHKPFEYFCHYGDLKHFKKSLFANKQTMMYEKTTEKLIMYDKISELQRKKDTNYLPSEFLNKNILRIETRLIKRVAKKFGKNEVRAKDLYNENFYIELIEKHKQNYYSINRQPAFELNKELTVMLNANNITEYLALYGIKEIGIENILNILEKEYRADNIPYYKYYKLKTKIKKLIKNKELLTQSNLLAEIDKKFDNAVSNYR